jgi:hypothetical protein
MYVVFYYYNQQCLFLRGSGTTDSLEMTQMEAARMLPFSCSAVFYCPVLYSFVFFRFLCCSVPYCTDCLVLHCTALYYSVLSCTVLFRTFLCCFVLHCTALINNLKFR